MQWYIVAIVAMSAGVIMHDDAEEYYRLASSYALE